MPTPQQFDEARRHAGACIDAVFGILAALQAKQLAAEVGGNPVRIDTARIEQWRDELAGVLKPTPDAINPCLDALRRTRSEPFKACGEAEATAHEAAFSVTDRLYRGMALLPSVLADHPDSEQSLIDGNAARWCERFADCGDILPALNLEHAKARQLAEPPQAEADAGGGERSAGERDCKAEADRRRERRTPLPDRFAEKHRAWSA